jgi:hypothetical protein
MPLPADECPQPKLALKAMCKNEVRVSLERLLEVNFRARSRFEKQAQRHDGRALCGFVRVRGGCRQLIQRPGVVGVMPVDVHIIPQTPWSRMGVPCPGNQTNATTLNLSSPSQYSRCAWYCRVLALDQRSGNQSSSATSPARSGDTRFGTSTPVDRSTIVVTSATKLRSLFGHRCAVGSAPLGEIVESMTVMPRLHDRPPNAPDRPAACAAGRRSRLASGAPRNWREKARAFPRAASHAPQLELRCE